jgi:hypothetical protein
MESEPKNEETAHLSVLKDMNQKLTSFHSKVAPLLIPLIITVDDLSAEEKEAVKTQDSEIYAGIFQALKDVEIPEYLFDVVFDKYVSRIEGVYRVVYQTMVEALKSKSRNICEETLGHKLTTGDIK